jgi:two-component system sensor histidine kinase ChvG
MPRSRLLLRLILVNTVGLTILVIGMMVVSESRQTLVNAHKDALLARAQMMSRALGDAAGNGKFQFMPGPSLLGPLLSDRMMPELQAAAASEIIGRMSTRSSGRVRLYALNGAMLVDSATLGRETSVVLRELPPLVEVHPEGSWRARLDIIWDNLRFKKSAPLLDDVTAENGLKIPEIRSALQGKPAGMVRRDELGRDFITVAVPVQSLRAIIGAVMLNSGPGEIDAAVYAERKNLLELLLIALVVNLLVSFLLAQTLSSPITRLARGARAFNSKSKSLPSADVIPDLSGRNDEIGDLSVALRDMVEQILSRLKAMDQFAADVAHELKNPLTSLYSAFQGLRNASDQDSQEDLADIIEQDVLRLNRLISDISDASRLDVELSMGNSERFDLSELVRDVTAVLATTIAAKSRVELVVKAETTLFIDAQRPQIVQILDNLIANAVSFSPENTKITVVTRLADEQVELIVSDEGRGIVPGMEERIFERFYSDRTETPSRSSASEKLAESGHSGLGLSISRQIARVHGGDLFAANRPDGVGAYFTLRLPLAKISGSKKPKTKSE